MKEKRIKIFIDNIKNMSRFKKYNLIIILIIILSFPNKSLNAEMTLQQQGEIIKQINESRKANQIKADAEYNSPEKINERLTKLSEEKHKESTKKIGYILFGFMAVIYMGHFFYNYFRPENIENRRQRKEEENKRRKIESIAEEENEKRALAEREKKWQQQEAKCLQQKEKEYQRYSNLRKQIEQMPIYQRWRQDVLKKCGNKCQMCGCIKNLEVHHRISIYKILKYCKVNSIESAFECKPLWDINNGEALCKECHDKMESSKNRQFITLENNKPQNNGNNL